MARLFLFLLVAVIAAPALAQESAPVDEQFRDSVLKALRDRIQETEASAENSAVDPGDGVIDFEVVRGDDPYIAVPLATQYQRNRGVVFSGGAAVHYCTDAYDEFERSACPYPRAASGSRAALSGGRAPLFDIRFSRLIQSFTVRINPTGGQYGERFAAELHGFDAAGKEIAKNSLSFVWDDNAFTWPTSAGLKSRVAMSRVTIQLRRVAANNQPVQFLIDDLALIYTPETAAAPPVAAGIAALDGPPKAGRGVIVQSPEIGPAQATLHVYPAAIRKRLSIDWNAVDAALADQQALGLAAVAPVRDGAKYADLAELPLLLPADPDPGTLMVFGNADSVNAVWRRNGRGYAVYGSRLATVLSKPAAAPGVSRAVTFSGTSDDLTASFSLYGASYAMSQFCLAGGANEDPGCYDRDRLGEEAAMLIVAVGEAARRRP